jgi:uncharacterized membrane protein YidH (DUF202 family)
VGEDACLAAKHVLARLAGLHGHTGALAKLLVRNDIGDVLVIDEIVWGVLGLVEWLAIPRVIWRSKMRSYHTLQEALVEIVLVVIQAFSVLAVSCCFLDLVLSGLFGATKLSSRLGDLVFNLRIS